MSGRSVLAALAAAAMAMGLAVAGPAPAAAAGERPMVSEIPDDGVPAPGGGGASLRRAAPTAGIPAVDQIVSSPNVLQIANVPKQAPFTTPGSFGTDIAFQKNLAYVGNYDGFVVYDVSNPAKPRVVSQVLCPGSQNDISISGNLLFVSTDSRRSDDTCSSAPQPDGALPYWEGIKIFDVKDPAAPKYVKSVATDCGSHTNTLVPDKAGKSVYIYVSSYSPAPALSDCQPPHDKISIIEVPRADPTKAAVVAEPVLFPDGGNPGPGSDTTTGCHDITVFPAKDLAAGACMGDGVLMDISDRKAPRVFERVRDDVNFAFWHSATFNNTGTKVVFTDELGGGGAATCNAATGPTLGADGIYDITGTGDDRSLVFRSYFKIPRMQADTENCVAHNGSLIPVKGRDLMVQAWYQGGISIWDFTDSAKPKEIGFWERGPLSTEALQVGGSWSAYWYNGFVYSSDIQKGLDVLAVIDPRIISALPVRFAELNVQSQPTFWR